MKGIMMTQILLSVICFIPMFLDALDNITTTQFMKDGDTMFSSSGSFEMGFFSPGDSKNRYVGVWYNKVVTTRTVVWVANREVPVNNTSGMLKVIHPGILVLVNGNNDTIWSTNTSKTAQNPFVELLDSGNLVVKESNDENPESFLWQGFDYPSDTLLPGMKMGKNFVTGIETFISSWKSADDPARGTYSVHCTVTGYPQISIQNGSTPLARSGPWNGHGFHSTIYTYELVFNNKEVYYSFHLLNSSIMSRYVINPNGLAQRSTWVNQKRQWVIYLAAGATDDCENYALCGAYGSCNLELAPICTCLNKFVPKDINAWDNNDWTNGCVRRAALDCKHGEGFLKYERLKLPDTKDSWFNTTMTLEECRTTCLHNCSCTAYTNLDTRGAGSGCLLWFGELINIRELSQNGQDIFIRMASSELGPMASNGNNNNGGNDFVSNEGLLNVIKSMGEQMDRIVEDARRKDNLWQARFDIDKRIHKEEVSELKARLQELTDSKAKFNDKACSSGPTLKSYKGTTSNRVFTPLQGVTQAEAFEILVARGKIKPLEGYKPKAILKNHAHGEWCGYHKHSGHTTEGCFLLRNIIQDLIDNGEFTVGEEQLIKEVAWF